MDICDFSLNANFGDFEEDAYFRTKEKDVKGHVMHVEKLQATSEIMQSGIGHFQSCYKTL